jgi:hypothetical protein
VDDLSFSHFAVDGLGGSPVIDELSLHVAEFGMDESRSVLVVSEIASISQCQAPLTLRRTGKVTQVSAAPLQEVAPLSVSMPSHVVNVVKRPQELSFEFRHLRVSEPRRPLLLHLEALPNLASLRPRVPERLRISPLRSVFDVRPPELRVDGPVVTMLLDAPQDLTIGRTLFERALREAAFGLSALMAFEIPGACRVMLVSDVQGVEIKCARVNLQKFEAEPVFVGLEESSRKAEDPSGIGLPSISAAEVPPAPPQRLVAETDMNERLQEKDAFIEVLQRRVDSLTEEVNEQYRKQTELTGELATVRRNYAMLAAKT